MQERCFLQLTDVVDGGDTWLDADRIAVVRQVGRSTLVYLDGIDLPAEVTEDGATVMDRLHRAAEAMAAQA
jgi:hypothetical protein